MQDCLPTETYPDPSRGPPVTPRRHAAHRLALAVLLLVLLWAAPLGSASAEATASPGDARVYIGWPNDGQVLPAGRPIHLWFGLRNMGVAPRGTRFPNTGHHHLLIDTDLPPVDREIPSDRNHLHFGMGETETSIELPPGRHTLQLLMGDATHLPHQPPVYSKKITVTVR